MCYVYVNAELKRSTKRLEALRDKAATELEQYKLSIREQLARIPALEAWLV